MKHFFHAITRFLDKTLGIQKKDETLRAIRTINDNNYQKGIKSLEKANAMIEKKFGEKTDVQSKSSDKGGEV